MAINGKQRRRPHGSAWHWRQTDRWYYTPPGTKRRMPLSAAEFDAVLAVLPFQAPAAGRIDPRPPAINTEALV